MQRSPVSIVFAALLAAALPVAAQAPPIDASPAAAPAPLSPSAQLRPSLYSVQATLSNLPVGRWKRGSVRDEAADEIQAIEHEIRVNLPPLLSASDAAPEALSKALPVVKHVGAVYDVLLRVYDAARVAAPAEQVGELQVALRSLEHARLSLDGRLQAEATRQEQQMIVLRGIERRQATFKCPAPPPAKPCPKPRVHHYARHRRTPKPAEKKKTEPAAKPKTNP
ncbi:MAG TPA: hypothetical protein VND90_02245 [Terracidiphilus sp.]|nr:hypothetical protein [Terracidiphilus sp.]